MKKDFDLPLINAHAHSAMIAFRGIGEGLPLHNWLNDCIWPMEAKTVNPEFVFDQTKLAIGEMEENGIRAFMDMYFFEEEVARAAEEMEMPVVIGEGLIDVKGQGIFDKDLEKTEKLLKDHRNNKYVRTSVAPHSPYTVNKENLVKAKKLAEKYSAIYQIHVSETKKEYDDCMEKYGMTPIAYLDSLGILDEKTVLVHCVWLSDEDIDIIAKRKCKVVHCPLSNLKLGSGIFPLNKLLEAGVIVALGTDGAASSNRLDIWEAGKFASLLQKGYNLDPTLIPSKKIIEMMTINGILALGLEDEERFNIKKIREKIDCDNFDYIFDLQSRDLKFN